METTTLAAACLLAITAAGVAAPAAADGMGMTSLSNFRYRLIDLDVNDGVTPRLELLPATPLVTGRAYLSAVTDGHYAGSVSDDFWGPGAPDPLNLHATIAGSHLNTALSGRADLSTLVLTAGGSNVLAGTTLTSGYTNMRTETYQFTLTGNTGIVFEADMHSTSAIQGRAGVDQWYNAASAMQAWLMGPAPDNSPGVDFYYGSEWLLQGVQAENDDGQHLLATAGTLQLAFQNITDATRSGQFNYMLQLNMGATPSLPIPEPAAYWMLGAGLGVCGLWSRKRAAAKRA